MMLNNEQLERLRVAVEAMTPEDMSPAEQALTLQLNLVMAHQVKCFKLVTWAFRMTALNFALVAILYFWMWPDG